MEEREAEAVSKTKEQVYREQLQALGIYHEILEPEIKAVARVEREYTRAQKAWSATASPAGSAPSFLDPHYAIVQKLRAEGLQHREALMTMAKTLAKLTGAAGVEAPEQKDLITAKLDRIAERVAGYDSAPGGGPAAGLYIEGEQGPELVVPRDSEGSRTAARGIYQQIFGTDPRQDPFAGIREADEAAAISDMMDRQEVQITQDVYEATGDAKISHGMDEDLAAAVAEDMG